MLTVKKRRRLTDTQLRYRIWRLMQQNRRHARGFQYTVPSPKSYPFQWLWDSCFHAVILSDFAPSDAKKELRALASHQLANGMIPHMIYWEPAKNFDFPLVPWGRKDTSSLTQPPMLAYAAWRVYQTDEDKHFLEELYPAMKAFYWYFMNERDPKEHDLVGIINPDESGEDNSPRFDTALGLPPKHTIKENYAKRLELIEQNRVCKFEVGDCMSNFLWVRDVPFNAILARNLNIMASIATVLGKPNDADSFHKESDSVIGAMRKYMLEGCVMHSTYGRNYRKVHVKTWAIFSPLFAEALTFNEAKKLVSLHLNNPREFRSPYAVPTVAMNEPSFDPKGFWRGPVWMATNWLVIEGLMRYGFKKEASRIARASRALVEREGFREQFHPITGEGQGAEQFTWSGLVLDMQKLLEKQ